VPSGASRAPYELSCWGGVRRGRVGRGYFITYCLSLLQQTTGTKQREVYGMLHHDVVRLRESDTLHSSDILATAELV